jgi:hypothetical protein
MLVDIRSDNVDRISFEVAGVSSEAVVLKVDERRRIVARNILTFLEVYVNSSTMETDVAIEGVVLKDDVFRVCILDKDRALRGKAIN